MPLKELVKFAEDILTRNNIPHVFTGGVATSVYAKPRATQDIDIVTLLPPEEVDGFLTTIENAGLKIARRNSVLDKLRKAKPSKIIWDDIFSLDLRIASYKLDYSAIERAIYIHLFSQKIPIATPEDLIVYKLASFRKADQYDIEIILQNIKKPDWSYISKMSRILAEEANLPQIMKNFTEIKKWR